MKYLHPVTVKGRLIALWHEERKIEKDFRERIEKLNKRREALRDRCLHQIQYHSSPCGGSDSYYDCSICGKQSDTGKELEQKP